MQWWSRSGPTGSKGVKGWAYRVPEGQGEGLQGLSELSGRPTIKGEGCQRGFEQY